MVIAEVRYLRTKEPVYLDLAQRWAKGTAILFAYLFLVFKRKGKPQIRRERGKEP